MKPARIKRMLLKHLEKTQKDFQKIWELERLLSEILYISSEDYENYLLSQNTEEAIHFIGS